MKTLSPLPYLGDDRLLLAEIDHALGEVGPILYRASERHKLGRLAEHGTDRGGYPGERPWRGGSLGSGPSATRT
jgi:hypothetical protein